MLAADNTVGNVRRSAFALRGNLPTAMLAADNKGTCNVLMQRPLIIDPTLG